MIFEFDYTKALYRRNNFGKPTIWYAMANEMGSINIYHGVVGKTIIKNEIISHRLVNDEIKSCFTAKHKVGYKLLCELKDDYIHSPVEDKLLDYLNSYLPYIRTDGDDDVLPMLAKTYNNDNNKLFNKIDYYIGQYKINGLRCFINAYRVSDDLFKPIGLRFRSREGTIWTSLSYLEEYLLNVIPKKFLERMLEEDLILDGEVYNPTMTVNEIDHAVKDPKCEANKLIQFWCYDIAIENMMQKDRSNLLISSFKHNCIEFNTKNAHIKNDNHLVILPSFNIYNEEWAKFRRNINIDLGFEGIILRNPNAEYQYGKRNSNMLKYKRATDGKFKIISINLEGIKRSHIPIFTCQNDINDSTFECHVGGDVKYQASCLINKESIIGKYMFVEFGERSGVAQVPFHIKFTKII